MGVFGGLTGSWGGLVLPFSSIVSHLLYSIRFCVEPNTVQLDNPVCSSGSRWCALCSDLLSQARAEEIHEGGEEGEPDGCNHFAGILHFILIYTLLYLSDNMCISVWQAVCGQQMLCLEWFAGKSWISIQMYFLVPCRVTFHFSQGRVVEFAPGEQSVDRSTLHSVCRKSFFWG